MMTIFRLIHAVLGISAIGAGAVVCLRMAAGHLLDEQVAHFLKLSLAASTVGMILSIGHTSFTQWLALLGVYVSAFAVLSLRNCQSNDGWETALVMSTMCVLCLDAVVAMSHAFTLLAVCNVLGTPHQAFPFVVSMVTVVSLFAFLSVQALNRIHPQPGASDIQKVAR